MHLIFQLAAMICSSSLNLNNSILVQKFLNYFESVHQSACIKMFNVCKIGMVQLEKQYLLLEPFLGLNMN